MLHFETWRGQSRQGEFTFCCPLKFVRFHLLLVATSPIHSFTAVVHRHRRSTRTLLLCIEVSKWSRPLCFTAKALRRRLFRLLSSRCTLKRCKKWRSNERLYRIPVTTTSNLACCFSYHALQ
ncbi:unnamed protein product, partial [Scytosiphon promiscuus]